LEFRLQAVFAIYANRLKAELQTANRLKAELQTANRLKAELQTKNIFLNAMAPWWYSDLVLNQS